MPLPPFSRVGLLKEGNGQMGGLQCSDENLGQMVTAYLTAYARGVNRQRAGATGKLFSQAANLAMLPAAHDVMDALAGLLDNLALEEQPTGLLTNNSQLQIFCSQCWLQH